jgi:transcriptional regulator with XRE-family HTH domain
MRTRTARNRLAAAMVAKNRLVALGLAVIEAREQKGMSASELAEASGIPLCSLERIEAGEPDPDADADATTDKTAPAPELIAFGRMVRVAREQKGMSVAELAKAAGFKRRRLVRIEAGELDPRYDGLIALAGGLDVRAAAILPPDNRGWTDDGPTTPGVRSSQRSDRTG